MKMKINAATLKSKRKEKLWSQEELALASGLGLRTVQRIESSGKASLESLKSLASALEAPASELVLDTQLRDHYYNVQLGYTILAVLLGALAVCVWQFSREAMAFQVFITVTVILSVISTFFGTLSVKVTDESIVWYFGIGFWKKKIDLAVIDNVRQVKNKGWWGWGIRYYGEGWLYNVSGLGAVELTLVDGKRLRIGSDEPEKLLDFLKAKIKH